MNKGNHKKQQHPAGAEANQKRSAAVAVEESLGGLEEKYDEVQKRIERGQMTVLKSLSRSAVIVREIIALGDQLKRDPSIIKDILQFSDEELTDEKIEEKHQETLEIIEQINKTYKKVNQLRAKLD